MLLVKNSSKLTTLWVFFKSARKSKLKYIRVIHDFVETFRLYKITYTHTHTRNKVKAAFRKFALSFEQNLTGNFDIISYKVNSTRNALNLKDNHLLS